MERGLEQKEVNREVKCPECGKGARMTLLARDDKGEECASVNCKHCNEEYRVPLELVATFESIGAAIRDARRA